jgi:Zn-dependent M28 family amino/carboxypeptidase
MSRRFSRRLFTALAAVALAGGSVSARQPALPPAVRAAAEGISSEQLAWDVAWLAADEQLGRNTPSPRFDAAADYIAARLARAGLAPAGDAGGFRQHYELHETRVDAEGASLTVGDRRFVLGRDVALRSFATPLSGPLAVVYVQHGWVIPGRGIDPYAGVDVRGKLVVAHGPRVLPKGVELAQVGRVTVGAETPFVAAAKRGAAGVLFITQASDLVRWDEVRLAGTVRREMSPEVPSAYAAIPVTSLLMAPHVTDALFAGESLDGPTALRLADRGEFPASFQLKKTVTPHVAVAGRTVMRPFNVVARLDGSDPALKAETVTIAAHLDGAVGTRAVEGDAIYNAADDNASGSAALLAIAEQMAKAPRPKRTIVFVWDSGEEQGLWGVRWFVHQPPVPRSSIVAHINVDMIGASRVTTAPDPTTKPVTARNEVYVLGPKVLSAKVEALLGSVNDSYLKTRFNHDSDTPESEFFYPRTDAGPFLERGILSVGFTTGNHARYHLPSDEARFLDPVQMHYLARTIFGSLWALADVTERPAIDRPMPASVPSYK